MAVIGWPVVAQRSHCSWYSCIEAMQIFSAAWVSASASPMASWLVGSLSFKSFGFPITVLRRMIDSYSSMAA